MKLYNGRKKIFAFLTCRDAGQLLAADGIAAGWGLRQGDQVLLSWAEDGDEKTAELEGESFDPSGWHGIEATSAPFDIEIVHAGAYGGQYGYENRAVYDSMQEANLDPYSNDDRVTFFSQFVKEYIAGVLGCAVKDTDRFCFEIPDALVSKVEKM